MIHRNGEELSPEDVQALRDYARKDLYFFAKGVLGHDWLVPQIHGKLCLLLQKCDPRYLVVMPRGWLKTSICSKAFPLWLAIRNPDIRILITQNTFTNAEKKLMAIRSVVEGNDLFRTLFPDLLPDGTCTWKSTALQLRRKKQSPEATFEAAGVRTQITGRHYDVVIEDDTVAPDFDDIRADALTPTKEEIEQAIGWHRLVNPILVDPKRSINLVVGTRWFERDLISWVMENEPHYKTYTRAVRETNGEPDENGEHIWPERFDEEVLEGLMASMGPYLYSCLYMNKPIRSDDMVFQPEWFLYYDTPPSNLLCYTTVDLATDPGDTKGKPDYNVVMTTGKDLTSGKIYVLEYFQKQCSPSEVIHAIFNHVRKYSPIKVGIEKVAYQSTMQYWVRENMKTEGFYFTVEGLTHGRRSKESRIQGLQPLVHSGVLHFRGHMTGLVSELLAFPYGQNDDLSDALAMQLRFWALTKSKKEITDGSIDSEYDPFSLQNSIKRLEEKNRETEGMLLDTLEFPSGMFYG